MDILDEQWVYLFSFDYDVKTLLYSVAIKLPGRVFRGDHLKSMPKRAALVKKLHRSCFDVKPFEIFKIILRNIYEGLPVCLVLFECYLLILLNVWEMPKNLTFR